MVERLLQAELGTAVLCPQQPGHGPPLDTAAPGPEPAETSVHTQTVKIHTHTVIHNTYTLYAYTHTYTYIIHSHIYCDNHTETLSSSTARSEETDTASQVCTAVRLIGDWRGAELGEDAVHGAGGVTSMWLPQYTYTHTQHTHNIQDTHTV